MGSLSIWHFMLVALVVLLMFTGRGRISELMTDLSEVINDLRLDPPIAAAVPLVVVFLVVCVVTAVTASP